MSKRDKITEIAIIVYNGKEVVDSFESLVNPGRSIPREITRITGITTNMVRSAPYFYEIAKKIVEITEHCIFVAHNVRFDYGFLKAEFEDLGFSYYRKTLCTVQIARRSISGLKSYSLENLIRHFNISVANRHRAMDDVKATLEVFKYAMAELSQNKSLNSYLSQNLKELQLPGQLQLDQIESLPGKCGIYYMRDKSYKIIYIGKSINIRERILQHFRNISKKGMLMYRSICHIDWELTGSELYALLLESAEIKKYRPELNKAQRNKKYNAAIIYNTEKQYHRITAVARKDLSADMILLNYYPTLDKANQILQFFIMEHELCPSVNSGKLSAGPCSYYKLDKCHGACIEDEDAALYNERVEQLKDELINVFKEDFIIVDRGRDKNEKSYFIIENGFCTHMGHVQTEFQFKHINHLRDVLPEYQGNAESNYIIRRYLKKNNPTEIIRIN